ncbi:MAG: asparagine synthase (glutamine-hydrolyzing) [Gammaproteobacteria bacterium]|nr:asparagine synthase (glutamine-hydrolyzing) [Gammaproteobacteria bacterium]
MQGIGAFRSGRSEFRRLENMCGIFGTTLRLDEGTLAQTLGLLRHRGPDSQGTSRIPLKAGGEITLQHTRLAIQDLSEAGHQPMSSGCGRWHIVFNGEIYNHYDMRRDLSVTFRGTSDTETLVEYLAAYGIEKTLHRLNGIFAFAAFDTESQRLYVARDPYGTKPLYYVHKNGHLTVSSEIKPVLCANGGAPEFDPTGLAIFLRLRYVPSPDTLLHGVRRLRAEHFLEYDPAMDALAVRHYHRANTARFAGSIDEAVEAYHTRLGEAVGRQLLSDVPVGILLSGGIDSALVASLACKEKEITAYTVGFGAEYPDCELDDARETARVLGIEHRSVTVDPVSLIDELPKIIHSIEEPLGTTSVMAMWGLSELAKRDVTVVLTGQGSDEPWGGYRRYKIEHLMTRAPFLAWPVLRPLAGLGAFARDEGMARGLACLGVNNVARRFGAAYALFDEDDADRLLPGVKAPVAEGIEYWLDLLAKNERLPSAERMMRVDTHMNLADDLLLYGDKISMAFALEARVPMLDKDLMAFIESLPLEYRSTLRRTKIVHKLAAERYLPAAIVHRPKKGFRVPFSDWSRNVWKDTVASGLLDETNPMYGLLDRSAVEKTWRRHLSGQDLGRQIFALLTLALWSRSMLGGTGKGNP